MGVPTPSPGPLICSKERKYKKMLLGRTGVKVGNSGGDSADGRPDILKALSGDFLIHLIQFDLLGLLLIRASSISIKVGDQMILKFC